MRRWLPLLALVACERAERTGGQVTLEGTPGFAPERCATGERFGLGEDVRVFHRDEQPARGSRVGILAVRGGARAMIWYTPPGPEGAESEHVLDPHSHCSTFELTETRVRFDCDAQLGRRLRADLAVGKCE